MFLEQNKKSKKIENALFSILKKHQTNPEIRYFSGNLIAFLQSNHSNLSPYELNTQSQRNGIQIDFVDILLETNKFADMLGLFSNLN